MFFGLGSDGTVGASKNTVKILGENTPTCSRRVTFVYDSKKAGSVTVSHVRVSPRDRSKGSYLISKANFVACHQDDFHAKNYDML